jgi:hypothetical protein
MSTDCGALCKLCNDIQDLGHFCPLGYKQCLAHRFRKLLVCILPLELVANEDIQTKNKYRMFNFCMLLPTHF